MKINQIFNTSSGVFVNKLLVDRRYLKKPILKDFHRLATSNAMFFV